jgi:aminotransferase
MFERTIACGSLSKTYSITGWRLGYTIAPKQISDGIHKLHDYITLCAPAPLQEAAVTALMFPDSYYQNLQAEYTRRRAIFLSQLTQAGFSFISPQGAYFVLIDISPFGFSDDTAFCRWLIQQVGVAGVPGACFFNEPVNHLVRLNFAKRDATLYEAGQRLSRIKELV